LINLVDALCELHDVDGKLTIDESRCQVYVRAAAPPEELFFPDAVDQQNHNDSDQILAEGLSETLMAPARPNVSVYNYTPSQDPDAVKKVGAFSNLSIFTGEDERFAYVSLAVFVC
jgi:protein AFG1